MNNVDTELVEFYKFLSERAIIDDFCRGEGEAECAVKLYNKSKVKNNDCIDGIMQHTCTCKQPLIEGLELYEDVFICLNCGKNVK